MFTIKTRQLRYNKNPYPISIGTGFGFLPYGAQTAAIFVYSKTITIPQTPPATKSSYL